MGDSSPLSPVAAVKAHIEATKTEYPNPVEREAALGRLEDDMRDLLGRVQSYRGDARLQMDATPQEV